MEPQIQYCTSADGTRIAYATTGQGSPLVVCMPWGSSLELMWQENTLMPPLDLGRMTVGYDRRGVGASQREVEDLTLASHVSDLAAVVDATGLSACDMTASFDGAAVAIAYAAQQPSRVSRLVLDAAYAKGDEIGGLASGRGLAEMARGNWGLFRRAMADILYPKGPTASQIWYANMLRDSMSPETAAGYIEFQATLDVTEFLPKVQAATLVVHSRSERRAPVGAGKGVAAQIPGCRFLSPTSKEVGWRAASQFLGGPDEPVPANANLFPSGTAVILFADIVDSTALTERLGDDAFRDKARALDDAMRSAIRDNGGSPIGGKTLGDGVLAVFTSARQAITCAQSCHEAASAAGLSLHAGIHAGDVIREDDNVFGGAVNIAARIAAASVAGETLVSGTVRDLARTSAGVTFEDRGEQSLKGIEEPVRVFEINWHHTTAS